MKLNKIMTDAGIIKASEFKNTSGSYTCIVDLDKINVDSNGVNFRAYNETHMKELREEFNEKAVRNPVLMFHKETGKLITIDGRHTVKVLKDKKSYKTLTCDVFFDINDREASCIFHELNTKQLRMSSWDAFVAAFAGKYQFAIDIANCLEKHNLTTPKTEGYNKTTADISGFKLIFAIYKKGINFLNLFLTILRIWKIGPTLSHTAKNTYFQEGLYSFLLEVMGDMKDNKSKVLEESDLIEKFRNISISEIQDKAQKHSKSKNRIHGWCYKYAISDLTGIKVKRKKKQTKKKTNRTTDKNVVNKTVNKISKNKNVLVVNNNRNGTIIVNND